MTISRKTFLLTASLVIVALTTFFFLSKGPKPEEAAPEAQEHIAATAIIQLNPQAIQRAGIQTIRVQNRSVSGQLTSTAEVKANQDRVFHINSFVSGRVSRDNALLGEVIRQGQTLAVVQNLEVARIQANYIHELHNNEIDIEQAKTRFALAQKNLERERRLLSEGISPRKDYQQAESDATIARSALEGQQEHRVHIQAEGKALLGAYGMSPGQVHSETIRTGSPVTAPRSGIITKKNITLGDMVTPETVMYEVADLSQVWLDVTIYPQDFSSIHVGQTVSFRTDSLPEKTFMGRIHYVQSVVEEASRTYIARVNLDNAVGLLKPGMFGHVQIEQTARQAKPFIPEESVQKYGKETFVFVRLSDNRFRKQTVQLGESVPGGYLINAGVQAGDPIVGKGSFTLKAEMLKSQFAGEEE